MNPTHRTYSPSHRPRGSAGRLLVALLAAAGIALTAAGPVAAAPLPAPTGNDGWVRVAHLSPDTKAVDVSISALKGGTDLVELTDVRYGVVSDYMLVPAGTYVVSMVPSASANSAEAVIQASVKVEKDKSITVAAFGNNKDLRTRVFQDDLTSPEAGAARIRLIQASTVTDQVSVQTTTGLLIAEDAKAGDSTSYASVPAGPWDLELTGEDVENVAPVNLANGSVNTLFVLDNSDGGLTVMPVLDSASVGAAPIGGVQTGGGALAHKVARGFAGEVGSRR